jgi:hypothetical protein
VGKTTKLKIALPVKSPLSAQTVINTTKREIKRYSMRQTIHLLAITVKHSFK